MTAQWWIPNRVSPTRRGAFSTRLEGANRSKKIWICPACRYWHTPIEATDTAKGGRPPACTGCGERALLHFDSTGEAQHFAGLWLRQDHGRVRGLKHHPRFELAVPKARGGLEVIGRYEADAEFQELIGGEWVRRVHDFKPRDPKAQDPLFRWKEQHFAVQYGFPITIVS